MRPKLYFAGFAATMMVCTTTVAATVHQLAANFPPFIMAGLYFLTPLYFAASIWNSSRVALASRSSARSVISFSLVFPSSL